MLYRETKKQEKSEVIRDDEFYRKNPKIARLWLVDITLTSGEVLQIYVSGMTQYDAYQKADGYTYWINDQKLKNNLKTFRLMP